MSTDTSRRVTVVVAAVLCIVFLVSPSVRAEDPFADGPYPVGWWDHMGNSSTPTSIAGHGGNVIMSYISGGARRYLDSAQAAGVRVIMSIPFDEPVDYWVNTYKDHPALAGFSIAEEVWYARGVTLSQVQPRYDAIKAVSDKPVFICFTEYALNTSDANPTIAVQWKSAYDQFLVDVYPTRLGEPEFSRLEYEGRGKDFKNDMVRAKTASFAADRPWWAVLSGWGSDAQEGGDYRLPTYDESRFATYWALNNNPSGIIHFAYYRTAFGRVPAQSGEPYPHDGEQWIEDVYEPQTVELNMLGPGIKNGKVTGAASDDTWDIRTDVYQDPDTGKYYLVTLNSTTGSETPEFTVTLEPPPGEKYNSATPLFEGDRDTIPFFGNHFSDTFSQYEVHVYELGTMLLGDANGDGMVSADDYAAVQAGFGNTGATGLPGDANGTGTVSADDYASVRTNFGNVRGMGSGSAPEPATLALLGAAGVMMLRRRRYIN